MFPVIMLDGKTSLPEDKNIYYVISKGGIYLYKNLKTIRSLTRVDSISFLKELEGFAELKIPIIPKEIIAQSVGFLKHIYNDCSSEGGLILHLFTEEGRYELGCPTQEVSSGTVEWDNEKEVIPQGAIRICSIHSHGSGSAFHSTTDKEDEKNFDGIHITLGHMDEDIPSIVVSIVVNGNRFKLDENQISEYIDIDVIPRPIDGEGNVRIVQRNNTTDSSIYEDYQPTIGDHNLDDITTTPVSIHLKKWKGYTTTKSGYISDERRFLLDTSNYGFPVEWKSKFKYKAPKVYRWDPKQRKLVEVEGSYYNTCGRKYKGSYGYGYGYGGYDWEKWYDEHCGNNDDVVDDVVDGDGVDGYDENVPTYPLMVNPSYPEQSRNSAADYIPPNNEDDDNHVNIFPITGNCNKCIYKEIAQDAIDAGMFEDDEIDDYLIGASMDPIGMEDIPTEEYYGEHQEEEDPGKYDLHYDEKGNMVDCSGNMVDVMSDEEQNHIDEILSPKDGLDQI